MSPTCNKCSGRNRGLVFESPVLTNDSSFSDQMHLINVDADSRGWRIEDLEHTSSLSSLALPSEQAGHASRSTTAMNRLRHAYHTIQ